MTSKLEPAFGESLVEDLSLHFVEDHQAVRPIRLNHVLEHLSHTGRFEGARRRCAGPHAASAALNTRSSSAAFSAARSTAWFLASAKAIHRPYSAGPPAKRSGLAMVW